MADIVELDQDNEQDTQKNRYVTFKSGSEYFGLKIQYVNEIIVFQEITEVPETADYIMGLINLRGKIVPVIDVRLRFGQEPFPYNDRTCIIVIQVQEDVVGLIVEKIAEVVEIPEKNILPSPSLGRSEGNQGQFVYAIGKVGKEVKLLLDPDKLLSDDDVNTLGKACGCTKDDDEEEGEEES